MPAAPNEISSLLGEWGRLVIESEMLIRRLVVAVGPVGTTCTAPVLVHSQCNSIEQQRGEGSPQCTFWNIRAFRELTHRPKDLLANLLPTIRLLSEKFRFLYTYQMYPGTKLTSEAKKRNVLIERHVDWQFIYRQDAPDYSLHSSTWRRRFLVMLPIKNSHLCNCEIVQMVMPIPKIGGVYLNYSTGLRQ